jgi:hypothetical protein
MPGDYRQRCVGTYVVRRPSLVFCVVKLRSSASHIGINSALPGAAIERPSRGQRHYRTVSLTPVGVGG